MLARDIEQLDEPAHAQLIERALARIQTWEDSGIASPYYIRTWRRILAHPATHIPSMLSGDQANALVQNSPFGFAFSQPKYREVLNLAQQQD
ncbi:hypothetical protein [Denitratimonas sp. CY0512]|uniref:hypothetical protein n=1 Tax=Denitratimonas sp. CY0512 TaxID=3131940 RepID=UPI0030A43D92